MKTLRIYHAREGYGYHAEDVCAKPRVYYSKIYKVWVCQVLWRVGTSLPLLDSGWGSSPTEAYSDYTKNNK